MHYWIKGGLDASGWRLHITKGNRQMCANNSAHTEIYKMKITLFIIDKTTAAKTGKFMLNKATLGETANDSLYSLVNVYWVLIY